MAFTQRSTVIANPAGRRMTLKQKLHFGSKRQRSAARAALAAKRTNAGRRSFRKVKKAAKKTMRKWGVHETIRKTKKLNASKPKRRAAQGSGSKKTRMWEARQAYQKTLPKRKHNPGEIIALSLPGVANPAKRRSMAATKKKRRTSMNRAGRRPVTNRAKRKNPATKGHRHRRHNPAGYRWSDILMLGGGALVGGAASIAIPQAVLSTSNTGPMGYIANLVTTFLLAWLAHSFTKDKAFPAGILAGGVGALMRRIISDYSLLGSYSSQLGMGDYMVSNWVTPQRLTSDWRSLTEANMQLPTGWGTSPPSTAISSQGVSVSGLGLEGSQAAAGYLAGGSLGY